MLRRLAVATTLCLLAAAVGVLFTVLTLVCGAKTVSATSPDAAPAQPRCTSALHPMGPIVAICAAACAFAVWRGQAYLAIVAGVPLLALGILFGLSAGLYGVVPALLVLAAGVVGRLPNHPTVPPSP